MQIEPSPEQKEAISCTSNAVITAKPGSGKTFVLSRMIAKESEKLLSYQGVIAISYTNKASDELEWRCRQLGIKRVRSFFGTISSFCLLEIIEPFLPHAMPNSSGVRLVDGKGFEGWKDVPSSNESPSVQSSIKSALSKGVLPIGALVPAALWILEEAPQSAIYLKARFTSIFIDEYQDCGQYEHALVSKLLSLGLRAVVVGDLDQSIFQFAQKSPIYLEKFMEDSNFKRFEITQNYRCHKSIQRYATALLCPDPQDGGGIPFEEKRVIRLNMRGAEQDIAKLLESELKGFMAKFSVKHRNEVAVIAVSKRTLELFANALTIPYKLSPETELEKKYSKWRHFLSALLAEFYNPARFGGDFLERVTYLPRGSFARIKALDLLENFFALKDNELCMNRNLLLAFEIAKICLPDFEERDAKIAYRETVLDVKQLRNRYRPTEDNEINLLTYHKAKGLEFDVVFLLDTYKWILPNEYSKAPDSIRQALCMHYVGLTRARKAAFILMGSKRTNYQMQRLDAVPSEFLERRGLEKLRRDVCWESYRGELYS